MRWINISTRCIENESEIEQRGIQKKGDVCVCVIENEIFVSSAYGSDVSVLQQQQQQQHIIEIHNFENTNEKRERKKKFF